MKPTPTIQPETCPLIAFGAHPDDIEFGCGGVIAAETRRGRAAHLVVCSRGESATHGTPAIRSAEAESAAKMLGASLSFCNVGGDAHFQNSVDNVIQIAAILRKTRPQVVLAPTPVENQHPDHAKLGAMVRDACRLARYGGVAELRDQPAHAISQLFFYAITPDAVLRDAAEVLIDVSDPAVMDAWTRAMQAHGSQTSAMKYIELQLARARVNGLRAGVENAMVLFPADPMIVDSLSQLGRGARTF